MYIHVRDVNKLQTVFALMEFSAGGAGSLNPPFPRKLRFPLSVWSDLTSGFLRIPYDCTYIHPDPVLPSFPADDGPGANCSPAVSKQKTAGKCRHGRSLKKSTAFLNRKPNNSHGFNVKINTVHIVEVRSTFFIRPQNKKYNK